MMSINPLNNYNHFSHLQKKGTGQAQDQKLKAVSRSFEAFMIYQMFKSVKKNTLSSSLIPQNQAHKIFDDFLTLERSDIASKNLSLGIAKAIYRQNSKQI